MEEGLPEVLLRPTYPYTQGQEQRNVPFTCGTCSAEMTSASSKLQNPLGQNHHDPSYPPLPSNPQQGPSGDTMVFRSPSTLPSEPLPYGVHSLSPFEQFQYQDFNALDNRLIFDSFGAIGHSSPHDNDGYISTPSLVQSPPASRPRTCPDDITSFRSLQSEPSMSLDDSHAHAAYCIQSSSDPHERNRYPTPLCDQFIDSRPRIGLPPAYFANPGPLFNVSSPTGSLTTCHSLSLQDARPDYTSNRTQEPQDDDTVCSDEESHDDAVTGEPYAQLIYRALMSTAPEYGMVLKDIYAWFSRETDKAKNAGSKGWQNSIRHNLSMNHAFVAEKLTPKVDEQPKRTGNIWRLTPHAIEHGVQSTTRYRNQGKGKRTAKSGIPAPQRQKSGAKGGRAAKKAARARRVENSESGLPSRKRRIFHGRQFKHEQDGQFHGNSLILEHHTPTPTAEQLAFDWSKINGITDTTPDMDLFYDQPNTPLTAPFNSEPIITTDPVMEELMTLQYNPEPGSIVQQGDYFHAS